MVCSVSGARASCTGFLTAQQQKILHNEAGKDAAAYPMSGLDGMFFSEALGAANPEADDYLRLMARSIAILCVGRGDRVMTLAELIDRGREIQVLDETFANARIGLPLDSLHQCLGPDPKHPYAKITLCRTTFPVDVGGRVTTFFFEKFLVAYAYLDDAGVRRSTITPIHSHPLNFETAYFTSFGPGARVIEQEFYLRTEAGIALIGDNGVLDPRFFEAEDQGRQPLMRVEPGPFNDIAPSVRAIRLEPFNTETALRDRPELLLATDGLFRPHQVTVIDDPSVATEYFALDNYFGPAGRVLMYGQDGASLWSHEDWDRRDIPSG